MFTKLEPFVTKENKVQRFVLDENMTPCFFDLNNPNIMPFKLIARPGTPDDVLLERTLERDCLLITEDKGMIINAIMRMMDIVYQNPIGDRYFVPGSMGKLIASGCRVHKQYSLSSSEKRKLLLSQYLGFQQIYSGIDTIQFL